MTSFKFLILLFAGLLIGQNASAQSNKWGLPPSPNGKLISSFLDAVNDSDADVHRSFIEKNFAPDFLGQLPMEEHLSFFQQMNRALVGAQVTGVDMRMGVSANPTLNVLMKSPDEIYWDLKIEVLQGDALQIAGLGLEESADGPPPAEELIEALMAAINTSDSEVHRKFIEQYFAPAFKNELPMETHLEQFQQMHEDLADAELNGVEVMSQGGSDETVTMVMETTAGATFNVTFDMQATSPPRLITLRVSAE